MEQQNQAILTTESSQPIIACVFSKSDLKTLCEMLQESSYKAAEEEINHYTPLDRSPEQILADKTSLLSGFELKVTVQGVDDERVYGTIPDVFNSPRFPDRVKRLYINSEMDLRNLHDWYPRNGFELLLDFSKPEIFNLSLSPSISTPNASHIHVSGLNSIWVKGVYRIVMDFVKKRETRRRFFHRHSIYDLLMPCGAFPFAFSIASKFSGFINSRFSGMLQSAAYVYVFYLSLLSFRILFDYARWIFPIVEYKEVKDTTQKDPAQKHRVFLCILLLGVSGNFLTDVIRIIVMLVTQNP